jgi:hypothetical protein
MWLVTTLVAALIPTALWAFVTKKARLGFLSLMLWGLTGMITIDHVLGYEGGPFFEMETDGLISSGILLGILMLIPVILVWGIALIIDRVRGNNARNDGTSKTEV